MNTSNRLISIDEGIIMIVTDFHGDWQLYQRYRDIFLHLRAHDLAHTLLLTGDYVHSYTPPEQDGSLDIVLDLLGLKAELGPNLVVLLGNHEMPHIYPYILSRGRTIYTTRFEHKMGPYREAIVNFFDQLPFFVRTRAGVSVCHAGAFPQAAETLKMQRILAYSHQTLLEKGRQLPHEPLAAICDAMKHTLEIPYAQFVWDYFACPGPEDARYYDYIISQIAMGDKRFDHLWDVMHNRNEREYGNSNYAYYLKALLRALSEDYVAQTVLVTGHLTCKQGYQVVAEGVQLRIASGEHARPRHKARYLLFDAGNTVSDVQMLLPGLGCVFEM